MMPAMLTTHPSILERLPNEMLAEIVQYIPRKDLLSICTTSRLLSRLSIPFLYRTIYVSDTDIKKLKNILDVMEKYTDTKDPLSRHVHEFWLLLTHESNIPQDICKRLLGTLSGFSNIRRLNLVSHIRDESRLRTFLQTAHFPSLLNFQYITDPIEADDLTVFLNHHPTLTKLLLTCRNTYHCPLGEIRLPCLQQFSGNSCFVKSLVCERTLQIMCIFFAMDELPTVLERLEPMIHPDGHILVVTGVSLDLPVAVRQVADKIPNTMYLIFRDLVEDPALTSEDVNEIETQLKKFKDLGCLELDTVSKSRVYSAMEDEADLAAVEKWGHVCKSLHRVVLHGRHWVYEHPGWEVTDSLSPFEMLLQ
ncbi:hypothetical protein R3P38DRAFT_3119943, partial [Favolaschia claudopus]